MKLPISWINEYVKFPKNTKKEVIVEHLIKLGYEVEAVETFGPVQGPLVIGQVEKIEILSEFKKPIRFCTVNIGNKRNGIICGASNFKEDDLVVVALPGAVLPGDFKISERETYGKTSQGMICSARELGFSDNHEGIIVLPKNLKVGSDAKDILGLGETVLDISVLPDRGYAMSVRGIGRELALSMKVKYIDPVNQKVPSIKKSTKLKTSIKTKKASKIALVSLSNYKAGSVTPMFMQKRLAQSGIRTISLPVDITNYLMIEIGQPLHAFDADKINGLVQVRNAKDGEMIETLDHVKRKLNTQDLVIADKNKALSIAGVMGGLESEISTNTTNIVIESAVFDKGSISRTSRSHKLPSEASKRFERGTDFAINEYCAKLASAYLAKYGNAKITGIASTKIAIKNQTIKFYPKEVSRLIGVDLNHSEILKILKSLSMKVVKNENNWKITPPTWRHDINNQADVVEEIIRIWGYEKIPSRLPKGNLGSGLTKAQKSKRNISIKLASLGLNEVLNYPFIAASDLENLLIPPNDKRRQIAKLANPLSEDEPFLRTTLLPGLIKAAERNLSRGTDNIALYEHGSVYLKNNQKIKFMKPRLLTRPSKTEIIYLDNILPLQPKMIAGVIMGEKSRSGWWSSSQKYDWHDPIEVVVYLCRDLGFEVELKNGNYPPFHPGRCAEISISNKVIGYAGELNPGVIEKTDLSGRVFAFEVCMDDILEHVTHQKAPFLSVMPVVKEDLAFVVDKEIKSVDVIMTIQKNSEKVLESVRLFDVYEGSNIGQNKKSLAFSLRFRAEDRTLTSEEISKLRSQIVKSVEIEHKATLRA